MLTHNDFSTSALCALYSCPQFGALMELSYWQGKIGYALEIDTGLVVVVGSSLLFMQKRSFSNNRVCTIINSQLIFSKGETNEN